MSVGRLPPVRVSLPWRAEGAWTGQNTCQAESGGKVLTGERFLMLDVTIHDRVVIQRPQPEPRVQQEARP